MTMLAMMMMVQWCVWDFLPTSPALPDRLSACLGALRALLSLDSYWFCTTSSVPPSQVPKPTCSSKSKWGRDNVPPNLLDRNIHGFGRHFHFHGLSLIDFLLRYLWRKPKVEGEAIKSQRLNRRHFHPFKGFWVRRNDSTSLESRYTYIWRLANLREQIWEAPKLDEFFENLQGGGGSCLYG